MTRTAVDEHHAFMAFPSTRYTLIRRIASNTSDEGWRDFLEDYWGPVSRFAARWGRLRTEDAEDVTSDTFEIIVRNGLLERWNSERRSKLRTLLCGVVRNVVANRARKLERRHRHWEEWRNARLGDFVASPEQEDVFYASWAEDVLSSSVTSVMNAYHAENRGDCFRVLYGRVCEGLTAPELADHLGLKLTTVEHYDKHSRRRLRDFLESRVRELTMKYASTEDVGNEFEQEWQALRRWLKRQGGLEAAIRAAARANDESVAPPS